MFHISMVIIIPIVLGIATYPIFDEPIQDEQAEIVTPETEPGTNLLIFMLFILWILFLLRIMYLARKGNFKARIKQW